MKYFTKSLFVFSILLVTCVFSTATQTVKIGVVDRNLISNALNEKAKQLNQTAPEEELRQEIKSLNQTLTKKRQDFQDSRNKGDKSRMESADQESRQILAGLEEKRRALDKLQESSSQSQEGTIQEAIKAVAQEQGYTSILEVSVVPFYQDKDNISPLVLQKLGITK